MTSLSDRTARVVGRTARASEVDDVVALLRDHSTTAPPDAPLAAVVVAVVADRIVGAAAAWSSHDDEPVRAGVAVAPAWLGEGVGAFLGRLLTRELADAGVVHAVRAPRNGLHRHARSGHDRSPTRTPAAVR